MTKRKVLLNFELQEEIDRAVSEEFAQKHAINISLNTIKKLKSMGKDVRPYLMKNNLIAYIIQAPLFAYFEKDKIDHDLFAVSVRYSKDYLKSVQDNMAKQSHDGTGINSSTNFENHNKEPKQKTIDAGYRIYRIKRELDRCSQYPDSKNRIHNKRYSKIIEYFLEAEASLNDTMFYLNIGHKHLTQRIFEALEIMKRVYEHLDNERNKGGFSNLKD